MFSNTLSFLSSHNVSDQVSHPYKTTGKIIVLYILIQTTLFSEKFEYCKIIRQRLQNIPSVEAVKAYGGVEVYLYSILALDGGHSLTTRPGRVPLGLKPPVNYLTPSQMVSGVCLENFRRQNFSPARNRTTIPPSSGL